MKRAVTDTPSEALNPYSHAARAAFDRLRWDVHPEAHRSRRVLQSWHNRHAGQTAVILCNGPSLNKVDFESLKNVFTFGLNKINLLFDRTDFRPSCVTSVNRFVIEQNQKFFNDTDIPIFVSHRSKHVVKLEGDSAFLHVVPIHQFTKNVSLSLFEGYTVTFVALQLAFHMGFQRVAIVGADHNFASKGPANLTVDAPKTDIDHFDPRYFSGNDKWQLPDLVQSEAAYCMAREAFSGAGRTLVNATVGGKLEVFERQSLAAFLTGARNEPSAS